MQQAHCWNFHISNTKELQRVLNLSLEKHGYKITEGRQISILPPPLHKTAIFWSREKLDSCPQPEQLVPCINQATSPGSGERSAVLCGEQLHFATQLCTLLCSEALPWLVFDDWAINEDNLGFVSAVLFFCECFFLFFLSVVVVFFIFLFSSLISGALGQLSAYLSCCLLAGTPVAQNSTELTTR